MTPTEIKHILSEATERPYKAFKEDGDVTLNSLEWVGTLALPKLCLCHKDVEGDYFYNLSWSDAKAIATMMNLADSLVELWEACEAMGQKLQSLPWRKDSHENHQTTMLDKDVWKAWNYGECQRLYDALEKLRESGGEGGS